MASGPRTVLASVLLATGGVQVSGQVSPPPPTQWTRPVSQGVDLAVNAGLGALTAAVRAHLAGRPFWRAFTQGAAGGAVAYGGKRIIGTRVPAVGFLGRQVAAVGGSMVRNAGDGRAPFAGAVLPIGPIRLYLGEPPDAAGRSRGVRVKLDFAGALALAYIATRPGAHFDAGASVLAGTPVFTNVPEQFPHLGEQVAGVIGLLGRPPYPRINIAHELVHVVQYDFTFLAWGEPAERVLAPHVSAGNLVHPYVDVGLNVLLIWLGDGIITNDEQRPWEHEAVLMTTRPWP